MKRQQLRMPKLLILCLISGIAIYIGCSKDETIINKNGVGTPKFLSIFNDELFNLHYEVETFTRVKPLGETTEKLDKLTANPIIGKHRVGMSVSETGEVNLEIENMNPSMNLTVPGYNLPNNLPSPHKSVIENGRLTLFSVSGNELYSTPVETFRLKQLPEIIKNIRDEKSSEVINDAIIGMQSESYRTKLDSMLTHPSTFGVTVNSLNQNVSSITIPPDSTGINQGDGDVVLLVEIQRNLLLGAKTYKGDGSTQMCMMIDYGDGELPTIKRIKQEMVETLPSGAEALVEMVSTFSNIQLTIN